MNISVIFWQALFLEKQKKTLLKRGRGEKFAEHNFENIFSAFCFSNF